MFKRLSLLVLAVFLTFNPTELRAHYDDTHYHFTYFMARAVGYTPQQAFRLASGNVSIDWDPQTEPVQQDPQLRLAIEDALNTSLSPLVEATPFGVLAELHKHLQYKAAKEINRPRIRFHAFMDCVTYPNCSSRLEEYSKAIEVIPENREMLWRRALKSKNPGSFFHFLMDEIPHRGYPSDWGHWAAYRAAEQLGLPMGATTDYLSYKGPERNRPTITNSLKRMKQFMQAMNKNQKAKSLSYDSSVIQSLYMELRRVNPIEQAPSFLQAKAEVGVSGLYERWKKDSEPDYKRAYHAVLRHLRNDLKGTEVSYPPEHFQYDLDEWGDPEPSNRDKWVLYGNLVLSFELKENGEEVDKFEEPIEMTVKVDPEFSDREPYEIETAISYGEETEIENLPVGFLVLEFKYKDLDVITKRIQLLKAEQKETILFDNAGAPDFAELYKLLDRLKELHRLTNENWELGKVYAGEFESILERLKKLLEEVKKTSAGWTDLLDDWKKEANALSEEWAQLSVWRGEVHTNAQIISDKKQEVENPRDIVCGFTENFDPAMDKDEFEEMKTEAERLTSDARKMQRSMASSAELLTENALKAIRFYDRVERFRETLSKYSADEGGVIDKAAGLLDEAHVRLDQVTDTHAEITTYNDEAQEILKNAQGLMDPLKEKYTTSETLKALEFQFENLAGEVGVLALYFSDFRSENEPRLEALRADFEKTKADVQSDYETLGSIAVPSSEPGEAEDLIAEAEAALLLAEEVKVLADETATCNDQLQGLSAEGESDAADRITNLNVLFEQHSKEGGFREGKTFYIVTAAYTVDLETVEATSIQCASSKLGMNSPVSTTVQGFGTSSSLLEIHGDNFEPAEEVRVCCSLLVNETDKVCTSARVPEAEATEGEADRFLAAMQKLLNEMKSLLERAELRVGELKNEADRFLKTVQSFEPAYAKIVQDLEKTLSERESSARPEPSAILEQLRIYGEQLGVIRTKIEQAALRTCELAAKISTAATVEEADEWYLSSREAGEEAFRLYSEADDIASRMDVIMEGLGEKTGEGAMSSIGAQIKEGDWQLEKLADLMLVFDSLDKDYGQMQGLKEQADNILLSAKNTAEQIKAERKRVDAKSERKKLKSAGRILKDIKSVHQKIEKTVVSGKEVMAAPLNANSKLKDKFGDLDYLLARAETVLEQANNANEDIIRLEIDAQYEAGLLFWDPIQTAHTQSNTCVENARSSARDQENEAMQEALDRITCPEGSNAQPMWDWVKREAYCGCLKPFVVGPGDVCMSREDAALAQVSCSHIGLSDKVYNHATGQVECVCAIEGDIIVPRENGNGYICSRPQVNTGGPIPGSRARSLDPPSSKKPDMSGFMEALAGLARERQQSRTTYRRPTGGVYDDIFAGSNNSSSGSGTSSSSTYKPPANTGTYSAGFGQGPVGQQAVDNFYGGGSSRSSSSSSTSTSSSSSSSSGRGPQYCKNGRTKQNCQVDYFVDAHTHGPVPCRDYERNRRCCASCVEIIF